MSSRSLTPMPLGFHGDRFLLRLVDELALRSELFLETGANAGSTLGYVARRFPKLDCHACEPDDAAHAAAVRHACVRPHVVLRQETSQEFLRRIEREHAELFTLTPLAWLDAHGYGFEWPLREEVSFCTRKFARGYLLIDDFRVPHDARFGFDAYDGQECSFEHVRAAIAPRVAWRLYYPAYTEHTSPWHPLRGWGLLQFGRKLGELPRIDELLPDVCAQAEQHAGRSRRPASSKTAKEPAPKPSSASHATPAKTAEFDASRTSIMFLGGVRGAIQQPSAPRASPSEQPNQPRNDLAHLIEQLRADIAADPSSAESWNDLGACLALQGDARGALDALAEALNRDTRHAGAGRNLKYILRALRSGEKRALAIAPGEWGRMVQRDPYADLRELVDVARPTIVAGGAHRGDSLALLREQFPLARIHAFEPLPELADLVRERFARDREIVVHCAALAAEGGTLRFRQLRDDTASSVLAPSAFAQRSHGARVETEREIEVLAIPLCEVVQDAIHVLELDLCGFELEALRGLGERLHDVRTILTEVAFVPQHEGQPRFADTDVFLRAAGFRLFHLYDVWSQPDGQVTTGVALYVNERHYA